MPQHVNAQSFVHGDPRARAAGRKGGRHRSLVQHTSDYKLGYKAGARNARRHIDRWIQEHHMDRIGSSPFVRIAVRLNAEQRRAKTPAEREAADEALSHFLRMAGAGRLDEWIASHPEPGIPHTDDTLDDSMAANDESDEAWA